MKRMRCSSPRLPQGEGLNGTTCLFVLWESNLISGRFEEMRLNVLLREIKKHLLFCPVSSPPSADSLHLHSPTHSLPTRLFTTQLKRVLLFQPCTSGCRSSHEDSLSCDWLCSPWFGGRAVGRCDLRPLEAAWATCCTLTVCLSNWVVSCF